MNPTEMPKELMPPRWVEEANEKIKQAGEKHMQFVRFETDPEGLCSLINIAYGVDASSPEGVSEAFRTIIRRNLTPEVVGDMTARFVETRSQESIARRVIINWEALGHELGRTVVNAERAVRLVIETKDKPEENASLLKAVLEALSAGVSVYKKANGNP